MNEVIDCKKDTCKFYVGINNFSINAYQQPEKFISYTLSYSALTNFKIACNTDRPTISTKDKQNNMVSIHNVDEETCQAIAKSFMRFKVHDTINEFLEEMFYDEDDANMFD